MPEMLLDRKGDAFVPTGYFTIGSEVDFLRHATDSVPLYVRGASLCEWAEAFFRARRISYREVMSPTDELRAICPTLTDTDVTAILKHSGNTFFDLTRPLTLVGLLQALDPSELWHEDVPNQHHAAEWLLWLYRKKPEAWMMPLLRLRTARWQQAATSEIRFIYDATNADGALRLLDAWLWLIPDDRFSALDEFPQLIPMDLRQRARSYWRDRATATKGEFFEEVSARPTPHALKRLAAQEAGGYYQHQPQALTHERMARLSEYLTWAEQNELYRYLAPSEPSQMPIQPGLLFRWFRDEYLPYRLWQCMNNIQVAQPHVDKLAHQFAVWYLDLYPKALMGQAMHVRLSFVEAEALARAETHGVTLLVVLDGLHSGDAMYVQQQIQESILRLTLIENRFVFAPLPTITEFCKPALFRGVPPARVDQVEPIGQILPENASPTEHLRTAQSGQMYIWRIQEPDHTYHTRNNSATLGRDVESQLEGIVKKISDIVNAVAAEIPLKIVITTDHGRLLARSTRRKSVPTGMMGHGRAAWGVSGRQFEQTGFSVEENIVYLHGERFGLPNDAAICLNDDSFYTNDGKTGVEFYPHGGVYPEEVIIPWLVFARDVEKPKVLVVISGRGEARKRNYLSVRANNMSEIEVTLIEIQLHLASSSERHWPVALDLAPRAYGESVVELDPWPSDTEARKARASIRVQLPNGLLFDMDAELKIESEDMYKQESILEGLDL